MYPARVQVLPVPQRPSTRKLQVITAILWLLFAAGLGLQGLAPRLKIQNRAFVLPSKLLVEGNQIRPDAIVQRERTLQWASGLCTLIGALALTARYRRNLAGALQIPRPLDPRGAPVFRITHHPAGRS